MTYLDQSIQIANSFTYDATKTIDATLESGAVNVEDDLNSLRSLAWYFRNQRASGAWTDALVAPSNFENGATRGIDDVNQGLHDVERKRVLRDVKSLTDVTVPASQNFVILALSELPGNTTAAVGSVTTLGTVAAAHTGSFGTHSLDEVPCTCAINPKNLMEIVDGSTRDPILSSGRRVYGLFQTENAVDGHTMTGTTPNRAQISFVRINAAGDDLEAVPFADIQNQTINYATRERVGLEDLSESDFLRGATTDVPSGVSVTRQGGYDGQGTTPVDLTTNATLDLEGAGIEWAIRDDAEAKLFGIIEGSAGGTSTARLYSDVDVFDSDAVDNDFANQLKAATGSASPVYLGVTLGHVETQAGDLHLQGAAEVFLDDGNQPGSTWVGTDGVKLSEDSAEWSAYRTAYGEVSLLNAIVQASTAGAVSRTKGVAVINTGNYPADTNLTGAGGTPNLSAQLPDYSSVTFVDDVDIWLNGQLMINGANAAANEDVYPGDTPANGDLKFEFFIRSNTAIPQRRKVITMIVWGAP